MTSYEALRRLDLCWWREEDRRPCELPGVPIELEVEGRAIRGRVCGIHGQRLMITLNRGADVELWHDPAGHPALLAA